MNDISIVAWPLTCTRYVHGLLIVWNCGGEVIQLWKFYVIDDQVGTEQVAMTKLLQENKIIWVLN